MRSLKFQKCEGKQFLTMRRICKRMTIFAVVAFLLCGFSSLDAGVAHALSFDLGEDVKLDVDSSLTYGAAWRAKEQHSFLVGQSAGNDNFDKGDMINNRFSALIDIDLQYKDYGLFVRPRAYYDTVYVDDKFTDATQDQHGEKIEVLDAFAYGVFDVNDTSSVSLRVGKQVVSWGESLFILNGVSAAMSPIDATAANVPGVELKDLFLPIGGVFVEASLTDSLTVSSFYQWDWEKSRLDEYGSFFSTNDLIDEGIREVAPGLRGTDNDPDAGQYGVALRYIADALNGTEFGLYYINYSEQLPFLVFDPTTVMPYHLDYSSDINLYGASVSGIIFDTNVAAEVTYRQDFHVPVVAPVPFPLGFEPANVIQAQISTITIMPQTPLYSNMQVTTEFGVNQVVDGLDGQTLLYDRSAWGGVVKAQCDYYQVMTNLDLSVPVTYKFNPNGISSVQGTFSEGADSIGIAFNLTYQAVYKLGLGYTDFLNGPDQNSKADRDFYSLNLKYTF